MKARKLVVAVMATTLLFAVAGCSTNKGGYGRFPDDDDDDNEYDSDYDRSGGSGSGHAGLTADWLNGEPWFITENGLVISDPGSFRFPMGDVSSGDITRYPAFVKLEENRDGCKDGYKNVVATCTFYRDTGTDGMWVSAFDMYTGYTFECSDHSFDLYEGYTDTNYTSKDFRVGDRDVHVEWTFITEQKDNVSTLTLIVMCPEDYNGCVFQYGAGNSKSPIDSCDLDHKLYDINEIGYSGNENYVYFGIEARMFS